MGDQAHRAETRLKQGDPALAQQTTTPPSASRQMWERVETLVRAQIQWCIQRRLEAEVTTLWGRPQSARRAAVDASKGRRNGYGTPRR